MRLMRRNFVLTLLRAWLQLTLAADALQKPIHLNAVDDAAQTFVLRHIFYHDLEDPRHGPTAFAAISSSDRESRFDNVRSPITLSPVTGYTSEVPIISEGSPTEDYDSGIPYSGSVPNVTDKPTLINLAKMTSDVYLLNSSDSGWLNLTNKFRDSLHFGYASNGLRGHVFSNLDNSTVVVAFKGTSAWPLDSTATKDKLNDNLLFSCCCAAQRPFPYWYGDVCSCKQSTYKCNSTCLTSEIMKKDRYYAIATAIMDVITKDLFPNTTIWTTGHSLGGALASLMGLRFNVPAVTFESPPNRLAARRLGLVSKHIPPIFNFGNTADPVFQGSCNGFWSTCAAAGFSFESSCFTGKVCAYDTVLDKGWSSNIINHKITTVIDDVLKKYNKTAKCLDESPECFDCYLWNFD